MRVVVGRIGRAQGIRGEVTVEVRTDAPEERFSAGALVHCSGRAGLPATVQVAGHRWQNGRLILSLAGVADRNAAERLRGALLEADVDISEVDEDEFHDLALVGLEVRDRAGTMLGTVREVVHLPGQDLLAVSVVGQATLAATEADPPGDSAAVLPEAAGVGSSGGSAGASVAGPEAADTSSASRSAGASVTGPGAAGAGHDVTPVPAPDSSRELLVPFVTQIVPVVDLDGGFVVVDLPEGLDDLGGA